MRVSPRRMSTGSRATTSTNGTMQMSGSKKGEGEGGARPGRQRPSAWTWAALGAGTLFVIAVVIFTADNSQDVSVRFVGLHAQFPLALCLLCAVVAGVALVIQVQVVRRLRARRADRRPVDRRENQ